MTATDNDGTNSQPTPATSAIPAPPTTPSTTTPSTGTNTSTSSTPTTTPDTPNGTPASETALLHLKSHTIIEPFAKRAFKLTGQLTNNQGQPIADATLELLQRTEYTNTLTPIAHATTSPTGAFSLTVPAGPSRLIEVAYRAFTDDASYAATATVEETVRAGAHLTITPPRTSPTGEIIFTGKVQGPIPHNGVKVEILVHYHGSWVPIRTPRTNSHGYFKAEYTFDGSTGHFPFYAKIPAGQANFPYTQGHSNTINVTSQ